MSNLTITIAGSAGQGKTSTAFMIAKLLTDNGFIVDYQPPDFDNIVEYDRFKKQLPMDGAGKIVEIKELQTTRRGSGDSSIWETTPDKDSWMHEMMSSSKEAEVKKMLLVEWETTPENSFFDPTSPAARRSLMECAIRDMNLVDGFDDQRSVLDSINFAQSRITEMTIEDQSRELKMTLGGYEMEYNQRFNPTVMGGGTFI